VALPEGVAVPGITVGIDGSDHSRKALEWAIREAGLRGTSLTVLAVHQVASNHWTGDPETYAQDRPETEIVRQAAEDQVQKALSQVGEPAPTSVTVRAVSGVAAHELVAASADADLVVVGSQGGGGFARMVLGSVSSQVASHAQSPVVVIR
jgi:nucleotide-binding universal stress UspA family protein